MEGAGHYGIFSGRRWRDMVYPRVRDFIARFEQERAGKAARPAAKKTRASAATAAAAKSPSRARKTVKVTA